MCINNCNTKVKRIRNFLMQSASHEDWNAADLHCFFIAAEIMRQEWSTQIWWYWFWDFWRTSSGNQTVIYEKMLDGNLLWTNDCTKYVRFLKLETAGKISAATRLIINFCNFGLLSICTEIYIKKLLNCWLMNSVIPSYIITGINLLNT